MAVRRSLAPVLGAAVTLLLLAAAPARADSIAINNANVPANVGPSRFDALVQNVAGRWSVGVNGESQATPGQYDGVQVIGFSPTLPPETLGQWNAIWENFYSYKRKCRRVHHHRRCKRKRVFRYQKYDADILINATVPWNPGPAHPPGDQYDLESVLLHEFGHFAQRGGEHKPRCSGDPMTESLAPGEWWRDYNDWYEIGCANSPSVPAKRDAGRLGSARFAVRVTRLPDVIVPLSAPKPRGT